MCDLPLAMGFVRRPRVSKMRLTSTDDVLLLSAVDLSPRVLPAVEVGLIADIVSRKRS